MKLGLTEEQNELAAALADILADAGTPDIVRSWGAGDAAPGLKLWGSLAEMGLMGLGVDEARGGPGAEVLDLVVVAEQLGRHSVVGPWLEHAVYLPALLRSLDTLPAGMDWAGLESGSAIATCQVEGLAPRALDADIAAHALIVTGDTVGAGRVAASHRSMDPSRRLFTLEAEGEQTPVPAADRLRAADLAALVQSAQLWGGAQRMLELSVDYLTTRRQFGRAIGEYQALKHHAANVRIGLDFSRPLVLAAAVALQEGRADAARSVSAAKARVAEVAEHAAATALQLHGAIGYTAEYDLSLLWLRTRALAPSWGTPAAHRARVLRALEEQEGRTWPQD